MIIAEQNGNRITAKPTDRARCPICKEEVIAKCGEIKVWHWAHKVGDDCDPWGEGETSWHYSWKLLVPEDCREVVIGEHRADILLRKTVWELQHSSLSVEEIRERRIFYKQNTLALNWLWDLREVAGHLDIRRKDTSKYRTFRWKWPRVSQIEAGYQFWDIGNDRILYVKALYDGTGGWGYELTKAEFIQRHFGLKGA